MQGRAACVFCVERSCQSRSAEGASQVGAGAGETCQDPSDQLSTLLSPGGEAESRGQCMLAGNTKVTKAVPAWVGKHVTTDKKARVLGCCCIYGESALVRINV